MRMQYGKLQVQCLVVSRIIHAYRYHTDAVIQLALIQYALYHPMGSSHWLNSQSVYTFITFICAMIKHPDIQRRAQAELDRVIKPGHLPTMEDEESLPYMNAILKEVLREASIPNRSVFCHFALVDYELSQHSYSSLFVHGG